jgi:hypothetical protein
LSASASSALPARDDGGTDDLTQVTVRQPHHRRLQDVGRATMAL